MKGNILILDDNKSVLTALEMLLQTEFDNIFTLKNPNTLLAAITDFNIDVVLLDMNFKAGINSGNEGIFFLNQILERDPSISVILITAFGDVELAVRAVKEGAFDFILKPWDNNKIISTVSAALKLRKSKVENASLLKTTHILKQELKPFGQAFIGQSPPIKNVLEMVRKVAATDANIFITGENGTGKELIAHEIHRQSKRANEVMLGIDMGAINETLFESELFGHVKGSFTDAKTDRTGKFEAAEKGTLFLDEIGNLSLTLQAKILSALQNRSIVKIGSNTPVPIDIRLISATNKNLLSMISDGLFREDLLYRINTITIDIPPLRERGSDIILLAEYFLHKYTNKYDKFGLRMNQRAIQKLLKYKWPGNVRELQHTMEKAVILANDRVLGEDSFALCEHPHTIKKDLQHKTLDEMEAEMIQANIHYENGNMSAVAKNLGISRQALYNKLKRYGI